MLVSVVLTAVVCIAPSCAMRLYDIVEKLSHQFDGPRNMHRTVEILRKQYLKSIPILVGCYEMNMKNWIHSYANIEEIISQIKAASNKGNVQDIITTGEKYIRLAKSFEKSYKQNEFGEEKNRDEKLVVDALADLQKLVFAFIKDESNYNEAF